MGRLSKSRGNSKSRERLERQPGVDAYAEALVLSGAMTSGSDASFQGVSPGDAEKLLREGQVRVLDVRTPEEFRDLGHIPGAMLLPVDLIASAPATIPGEGKPLLICCEHGIRSAAAAGFLARAGFEGILNLAGGMSRWNGPREFSAGAPFGKVGPASWLVENASLLPRGGEVLDVACGSGRHALLLAAAGFRVKGLDRDAPRIATINLLARRLGLPLHAEVADLELKERADLGESAWDLVVVIHYLHRPLFPSLIRALRPGGILLYETFTREQARRGGRPTCAEFLLEPGELPRRVAPLEILREREGEFEGRMVSSVVARRSQARP
jgi:rhodanese-related sulfurtransferase